MRLTAPLIAAILSLSPLTTHAETVLLMAQEDGCFWCQRWDREIAPIYPKTAEGKQAPLRRYDIGSPPVDVTLAQRVHFTPTFVLLVDGVEQARIEGYPGEDFFWGLLANMLQRADELPEKSGS